MIMATAIDKEDPVSELKARKIAFVKRMIDQARSKGYYGTIELKFVDGVPISCKKIESFKLPE